MKDKTCQTCLHFQQHYSIKNGKIIRVCCGHCFFPKVKRKQPFSKACEHYTLGPPDEDAYADKKYLTKELLKYLLTLELLPQIEDISKDS